MHNFHIRKIRQNCIAGRVCDLVQMKSTKCGAFQLLLNASFF